MGQLFIKPDTQADIPPSQKGNAPASTPSQVAPSAAPAAPGDSQPHPQNHGSQGFQGGKFPQQSQQGNYGQNFQGKPYNRQNQGQAGGQGPQGQAPQGQGQGSAPGTPHQLHQQPHHQHQQGHRSGNYQNKNYYNNKRNYNNPKMNNQNQFQNYHYPANMYNYYQMYYQPGMVPGVNMPAGYSPQLPQLSQSPVQNYPPTASPAGPNKVKITDREGKQVNLEEKKKLSASSSALTTPVPSQAQIVPGAAAPAAKSQTPEASDDQLASAAAAAAAKKKEAAEEFRRKILEKAKAAKEKKEQEAKASAAKSADAAPAAVPAATPAASTSVAAPAAAPTPEESKKAAETTKEAPVEESKPEPVKETKPEPVQETKPEPVEETKPEPVEQAKETPVEEPKEAPVEEKAEPKVEEPVEKAPAAEPAAPAAPVVDAPATEVNGDSPETNETVSETAPTEQTDDIEEKDEEATDDDESTEKVFDLSSFFDRLSTCRAIEDPFTYPYPYPLTGVDARWKAGQKKYRYDPQFLFQFRDSVAYPIDDAWKEKLEGLGIVPNRRSGPGGPQRMGSSRFGGQPQGRMGGNMQGRPGQFDGRQNSRSGSRRRGGSNMGGNPRDRSLRNRNQSRRGPREKEDDTPAKPAEDVKPLVPSANRWVPRSRQKTTEVKTAPDGTVLLDKEDVERKVKSALNKLTLEMFEPISEQMLDIAKQSRHEEDAATIKQVISLTFAKACDEPYWSSVYAQFCAKMVKEIPDDIKDVSILTKSGEPAIGGDLARRILLATCQSEYEKGWVDKLPTNPDGSPLEPEMMSDEYYAMAAAKRRGLGLVKFIGNLYILNMLNDQVILHCLRDQSKNVTDPSEDSLENLAQLIKTVGPRFEASERNKAALNMIFDNVQLILDNCKLSSRIKFMLMDLQDLKKSNWKSLKQESGPKTIKEIHNEAELKKLEESKAQAEKRRNKGYDRGGYGGGDSRSNSTRGGASWGNKKESRAPTKDSRGFQSVPRSQSNRPTPDSSFSASHMSPRENSKRTDSMASNIFAALDGDNDDNESEGAGH